MQCIPGEELLFLPSCCMSSEGKWPWQRGFHSLCCQEQSGFVLGCLVWVFVSRRCLAAAGPCAWGAGGSGTVAQPCREGSSSRCSPGWAGQRSPQRALQDTALFARHILTFISPVFVCWSRGWCDQWTSEPAARFSAGAQLPVLSALPSALCCCSLSSAGCLSCPEPLWWSCSYSAAGTGLIHLCCSAQWKCSSSTEAGGEQGFLQKFPFGWASLRCWGVCSVLRLCSGLGSPQAGHNAGRGAPAPWLGTGGWKGLLVELGPFVLVAEQPGGWACPVSRGCLPLVLVLWGSHQTHFSSVSPLLLFYSVELGSWESSATSAVSSDPSPAVF